ATHDEVVREKWQDSFRPVRDANPAVPAEVAGLIEATLACDPRSRVQKAGQLASALAATGLAAELPSFAHGPGSPPGEPDPALDSPTRADHRIPLVPPEAPTPPPISPPGGQAFARTGYGVPAVFLFPLGAPH